MDSTDSARFDVFFAGECIEGFDPATVREGLGRLFRADDNTLQRLFSGQRQRIKGGVDAAMAKRYQDAMRKAGAVALILPVPVPTQDADAEGAEPEGASPPESFDFDLAPAGADILREDERPQVDAQAPPTDHLSVAQAGENLAPPGEAVESSVDAPDLEVAEPGSPLSTAEPPIPPDPPDTSGMSLSTPEHDLSDCAPPAPEPPDVSTEHLAVAQPGSDLLDESERPKVTANPPDTDHLSLSPDFDETS
ncbi:MAG: hypothetical protein AAFY29_00720 [Pseudomonadota bacterium]